MRGIHNYYNIAADVPMITDVVLGTIGLVSPIAAGEKQKIRAWVNISVGATGGVRTLVAVPAGATLRIVNTKLVNTVAPSITPSVVKTVFTNALANAGTHWLEIEADIVNGTLAGNVDIQMAQNTSDALTLTALAGSSLDVTIYS